MEVTKPVFGYVFSSLRPSRGEIENEGEADDNDDVAAATATENMENYRTNFLANMIKSVIHMLEVCGRINKE